MSKNLKIEKAVANYYDTKIEQHGPTSKGVDWNGKESQELRFEQLLTVVTEKKASILDLGCGYGAMYDFLKKKGHDFSAYIGVDISDAMLSEAKILHADCVDFQVFKNLEAANKQDYTIASGVFNVKQELDNATWEDYCIETIEKLDKCSKKGFSFNMLTEYSDKEFMREYLYYASPTFFFDYCKKHFSKNVALLHDYNLYEFTIIVRK